MRKKNIFTRRSADLIRLILILVFFTSLIQQVYAQTDTAWIYSYGGIQNDVCNQIIPTNDKGYMMVGTTNSFGCGNTDFYVIKTDSMCKRQWSKAYGGIINEEGFSATQTYDKGYAFVGFTDSYGAGGYDVFLVKTDSAGNVLWEKTYGGTDWDFGYSIQQLPDSGFIICGLTYSFGPPNGNVYVIRTDKKGDTTWTRAVGGTGYDIGNAICVRNDSLYAIIGATTSYGIGDTNAYFILMNGKGTVIKDTTYGSTHSEAGNSIRKALDNGFIIFGKSDSIKPGKPDEMLIKTDSDGRLSWMQIYHSSGYSIGHDAMPDRDGNYLAVSTSNAYGLGGYAMRLWMINSSGTPLIGPSFGGIGDEQGNSIAIGKNGSVVFAGSTNSPGNTVGLNDIYAVRLKNDTVFNIANYYALPYHQFKDTCSCTAGMFSISDISVKAKVFPNPVVSSFTILVQGKTGIHYSVDLYNEDGQCVVNEKSLQPIAHDQSVIQLSKGNLCTGEYFYQITDQSGNAAATGKIVIE